MKTTQLKYTPLITSLAVTLLVSACSTQHTATNSKSIEQSVKSHHNSTTAVKPQIQTSSASVAESLADKTRYAHKQRMARQHKAEKERKQHYESHRMMAKMKSSVSRYSRPAQNMFSNGYYAHTNIQDNEKYAHYESNAVKQTATEPVSTFSIDVDTGSYSNIRRLISSGTLPVKDAVRVEEMLNYFKYDYKDSKDQTTPFITQTEVGPSPWSEGHHLLQVGIKAVDIDAKELPAANLVFLIDVSGSMSSANKLGLLKKSLSLLVSKMRTEDRISLIVYAGASGVVLEPTSGQYKAKINQALSRLSAGGSTNGASGIQLAYQVAQQGYIKGGINRILLATDGDFNVGTVNFNQLKDLVEKKRKTGISLSTLGFGSGNYNDHLMEQLANAANGNYSYIDSLKEAHKVLVDEISSTLKTVAKDVKIQIEFNPAVVAEYRLIGYENRKLNKEDFNNDKVDAGEIGAGHTVTAFYELVLSNGKQRQIDALRYQPEKTISDNNTDELAFVKIRYKKPEASTSQLISQPVLIAGIKNKISSTSDDFRFASSVIGFAEILKGGKHQKDFSYQQIIDLSVNARGKDRFGYRGEFTQLVKLANSLNITATN